MQQYQPLPLEVATDHAGVGPERVDDLGVEVGVLVSHEVLSGYYLAIYLIDS